MTPPLTRETLAEIRRRQEAERAAAATFLSATQCAAPRAVWTQARRQHSRARDALRFYVGEHLDALLAAAERGLDAEGGR